MAKRNDLEFWRNSLKLFVQPHPTLYPEAGDIFIPRTNYEITFLCEGGLRFEGKDMEINFGHPDFLLVSVEGRITRIEWRRVMGFELRLNYPKKTKRNAEVQKVARYLQ